jgi:hypothetical protein
MSETWYAKPTGCGGQALIISELDGRNVAVAYEEKDAPLLAAAPKLIEAAKLADNLIRLIEEWADADQTDAEQLMDEIVALAQDERGPAEAIREAEGRE